MDYIGGHFNSVATSLKQAGFERVRNDTWESAAGRLIRWVSHPEKLRGVEGEGRTFVLGYWCRPDIRDEAVVRRFKLCTLPEYV